MRVCSALALACLGCRKRRSCQIRHQWSEVPDLTSDDTTNHTFGFSADAPTVFCWLHAWPHSALQPYTLQPYDDANATGNSYEEAIQTAPPPLAPGYEAQMRWRFTTRRTQHGIEDFKEGVASTPEARVHVLAEGSESLPFWYVHVQKNELASLFLSTPAQPTPCCWLKRKLRRWRYLVS